MNWSGLDDANFTWPLVMNADASVMQPGSVGSAAVSYRGPPRGVGRATQQIYNELTTSKQSVSNELQKVNKGLTTSSPRVLNEISIKKLE